jgi:hypothetical protein
MKVGGTEERLSRRYGTAADPPARCPLRMVLVRVGVRERDPPLKIQISLSDFKLPSRGRALPSDERAP